MVTKIGGVWTLHCPTNEQEVLLGFFERLDKKDNDERHEFFETQREIILKACYVPRRVYFCEYGMEPQIDEEEKQLNEQIEFYKANYINIISTNFSAAAFKGLITKEEKIEFDNYVQTLFGYWW